FFKRQLAQHVTVNPSKLPYNDAVIALLNDASRAGRVIVLATASDRLVAEGVARHFGGFSGVLASDGRTNLAGRAKLAAIVDHFNGAAFDYIGNSSADLAIWERAARAILVYPSRRLLATARQTCSIELVVGRRSLPLAGLLGALRIHQWSKNSLLF